MLIAYNLQLTAKKSFPQLIVIAIALLEHLLEIVDFGIPVIEYHRRLS
jgi:hypothetical protein